MKTKYKRGEKVLLRIDGSYLFNYRGLLTVVTICKKQKLYKNKHNEREYILEYSQYNYPCHRRVTESEILQNKNSKIII